MIELNKFIDFDKIFEHLYDSVEESLIQHQYESDGYKDIIIFNGHKKGYSIELEDCVFGQKEIKFLYLKSFNDANESNNQSTHCSYYITFNLILNEFTDCEYECG